MSQSRRERKVMPLRNKKVLGVLLVLICLSLLGCNQKKNSQTEVSNTQIVTNEEVIEKRQHKKPFIIYSGNCCFCGMPDFNRRKGYAFNVSVTSDSCLRIYRNGSFS